MGNFVGVINVGENYLRVKKHKKNNLKKTSILHVGSSEYKNKLVEAYLNNSLLRNMHSLLSP